MSMNSSFGMFDTSGSALSAMRTWMDAVSDNIANMHTARATSQQAWQPYGVLVSARDYGGSREGVGGGVDVSEVTRTGSPQGTITNEPTNPLADANGNVRYPDINLGDQMAYLLMAQRGYQANLQVVQHARDAYKAALQIGAS